MNVVLHSWALVPPAHNKINPHDLRKSQNKYSVTEKTGKQNRYLPEERMEWALQDLNLRPTDYESAALTN